MAELRNFSALGVKQQPLTRPARLIVMSAAVSHSSIEIPAANTAIARCSAGFRSVHEILSIACPRDDFRLFLELLTYNYSHTVSDSLASRAIALSHCTGSSVRSNRTMAFSEHWWRYRA